MQEQAGRTVQAALERQEKLPQDQRAAAVAANNRIPGPRASTEPSPEVDLIDQVLAGRSLIQMKPQVMQQQTQAKYAARLASVPAPAKSAPVAAATPAAKVATPPPPPVVQKVAPAASAVPLRPLPPRQAPPPPAPRAVPPPAPVARAVPPPAAVVRAVPPPAAARPVPAPAAVAAKPVETGRELRIDELELMAKSLQLLVKHRGGGPFGAGRLQSVKDIANLEINLLDTVKMLTAADGVVASTKVPVAAPVKQAPVAVKQVPVQAPAPVPVRAAAPAPAPVPVRAPAPVPVAAPVAVAAPVQTRMQAPMEEDDSAPKTIAQGLDQFLLAPNRRSVQVIVFNRFHISYL